jgi:hypothetical protein
MFSKKYFKQGTLTLIDKNERVITKLTDEQSEKLKEYIKNNPEKFHFKLKGE